MRQMAARSSGCGPPQPIRPLLKLTGVFDYQAEIDMALAARRVAPRRRDLPARVAGPVRRELGLDRG